MILKHIIEIFKNACMVGVAGYTIQDNFAQIWLLQESSMEPNFTHGDLVFTQTYFVKNLNRGDVILIKHPSDAKVRICKRIIGEYVVCYDSKMYFRAVCNAMICAGHFTLICM